MNKKIAIAGLGTVGLSLVKNLVEKKEIIQQRSNSTFDIIAVSARSEKNRGVDLSNYEFFDNPVEMVKNTDADIYLELMGGTNELALDYVKSVLKKGKVLITANKAMLASYGEQLSELADKNNAKILFESSIGGGIPCLKTLREGMAGNNINAIYGILNGTCNYILTTVQKTGRSFADVLNEAQKLGYSEADPTFDVEGYDAGQKLSLMASIGFGIKIPYDEMYFEGILDFMTNKQIKLAEKIGYTPRLIGVAKPESDGYLIYMVPALVPVDKTMGNIKGVVNACIISGDMVGDIVNIGAGAGGDATASAIIADIIDSLKDNYTMTFNTNTQNLKSAKILPITERIGKYCIFGDESILKPILDNNGIKVLNSIKDVFVIEKIKEEKINSVLNGINCNLIRIEDC